MDNKQLRDILKEGLDHKGLTVERLSGATGIPDRFLKSLTEGDFKKLPAAPYVRGYLIKMASLLDLDEQELWEIYKKEQGLKSSGPTDKLPANRFAVKKLNKKILIGSLLGILAGLYFIWNIGHLLGRPELNIIYPSAPTSVTGEPAAKLLGYIEPSDKLLINGEEVIVGNNGKFEKYYNLQAGLNSIEFIAKRFLGKETRVVKQVIYQPQ